MTPAESARLTQLEARIHTLTEALQALRHEVLRTGSHSDRMAKMADVINALDRTALDRTLITRGDTP